MHLHLLHTSSFSAVFLTYDDDDDKYVLFFSLGLGHRLPCFLFQSITIILCVCTFTKLINWFSWIHYNSLMIWLPLNINNNKLKTESDAQ